MRRINHRLVLIMVVAAMLLGMLVSTIAAAAEKVEIKIAYWDFGADNRKGYEAMAAAFNKSQDRIVAVPDPMPGGMRSTFLARVAGGAGPDIVWYHSDWLLGYVEQNLLMDLTPFIKKDNYDTSDFFPSALKSLTVDGKLYGLPDYAQPTMIGYNKDMFDAAGLEYPKKDWNWDDMLQLARKLTIRDGSGKGKQFGFMGFFGFFSNGGSFLPICWSNGGELYNKIDYPTECLATSKEVVDAVTYVRDFRFKYKAEGMPGEQTRFAGEDHFAYGECAMAYVPPGIIAKIESAKSTFRWDFQMMPRGSVGSRPPSAVAGHSVVKSTKHPEEAWEVLKFMNSMEGQMAFMRGKGSMSIHCRKSVLQAALQEFLPKGLSASVILETIAVGRTNNYRFKPGIDPGTEVYNTLSNVYAGRKDVVPALKQLKPVLDAMLRKSYR